MTGTAKVLRNVAFTTMAASTSGRAPGLWLPLTIFPCLAALLVLGELFWWE